jgi:predicted nucleic acid-binding protein
MSLLDKRPTESIWTTSVTFFEVRLGIERLAESRRRDQLEEGFRRAFDQTLQGRLLAFDLEAARSAAILLARRMGRGEPSEMRDTMIAGIVVSRRAELVTRNIRHFGDLGLAVINPWSA